MTLSAGLIAIAPNGSYKTTQDHPNLPVRADQLAQTALQCHEAGARLIHLHVRDENQRHSLSSSLYEKALLAIDNVLGDNIIKQISTESANSCTIEQQRQCLYDLLPEAASLAIREFFPNPEQLNESAKLLEKLWQANTLCQFIIYDHNDYLHYQQLVDQRIIPDKHHSLLFVLGRYQQQQLAQSNELLTFLCAPEFNPETTWMCCAFGRYEFNSLSSALGLNGHVRVGFENNLHAIDQQIASDNAQLTRQLSDHLTRLNRPIATVEQARELLASVKV